MEETLLAILLALVGVTVLTIFVALALIIVGLRRLHRRNQVSQDAPGDAPLAWLWSPTSAARLHRRLQAAVSLGQVIRTRHAGEADGSRAVAMAWELEREAVALDRRLTVIARLPPRDRRRHVPQMAVEVRRVEELVSRLTLLDLDADTPARLPHHPTAMEELAEQLDQLEESRRDLRAVEADVGLHSEPLFPTTRPQRSRAGRRARS